MADRTKEEVEGLLHEIASDHHAKSFATRAQAVAAIIAAVTALIASVGSLVKSCDKTVERAAYEELSKKVIELQDENLRLAGIHPASSAPVVPNVDVDRDDIDEPGKFKSDGDGDDDAEMTHTPAKPHVPPHFVRKSVPTHGVSLADAAPARDAAVFSDQDASVLIQPPPVASASAAPVRVLAPPAPWAQIAQ